MIRKLFSSCRRDRVFLSQGSSASAERTKGTRGQGPSVQSRSASTGYPPEQDGSGGYPRGPRISAEESDAFYILVRAHMDGWPFDLAPLPAETPEERNRVLSRALEANEDIRLLNDIGWEQGTGEAVNLTMAPHELRRVLGRYRNEAAQQLASEEREEAEARADSQRSREAAILTKQLCDRLLGELTSKKGETPHAPPSITDRQRAALLSHLFDTANRAWNERASGDDLERIAAEVHDSAALIADIGLEVVPTPEVDLTLPPGELRRMFTWVKGSLAESPAEHLARKTLVLEACERVLGPLTTENDQSDTSWSSCS